MIEQIKNLVSALLPGARQAHSVASRSDMLRHIEFYQFPRMHFGNETSPDELHLGVRDALLDSGAKFADEVLPAPISYWAMTPADFVGAHNGCESDYVAFTGSIVTRKGKPLPKEYWKWYLIGWCVPVLGWFLILPCCRIYKWWINKYANGAIIARYDGYYRRPRTDTNSKDWELKVDIMMSYNVEVPPFGETMGPDIVAPVFHSARELIYGYVKQGVLVERTQPQMVEIRASAYEKRFPIKYGSGDE